MQAAEGERERQNSIGKRQLTMRNGRRLKQNLSVAFPIVTAKAQAGMISGRKMPSQTNHAVDHRRLTSHFLALPAVCAATLSWTNPGLQLGRKALYKEQNIGFSLSLIQADRLKPVHYHLCHLS
jgi:hypothetical protein